MAALAQDREQQAAEHAASLATTQSNLADQHASALATTLAQQQQRMEELSRKRAENGMRRVLTRLLHSSLQAAWQKWSEMVRVARVASSLVATHTSSVDMARQKVRRGF